MTERPGIPGFDLIAPAKVLAPAYAPLRFSPAEAEANARRAQAERRATQARIAREAETALAEWQSFRDRHADSPVALAVLDVHQPEAGYDRVVCAECCEPDCDDTVGVEWQCATFAAMKEAADG